MRALVVYESMFGNTRKIAEAIAVGVGEHMTVQLVEVSRAAARLDPDVDLLVVGGPTHARGMTTVKTRAEAARRTTDPLVSRGTGIREWLGALRPIERSAAAAAFDTRIAMPMVVTGSAARGYAPLLRAAGFHLIEPTESFRVGMSAPQEDAVTPLEVDRAGDWGREIASRAPGIVRQAGAIPVSRIERPHLGSAIVPPHDPDLRPRLQDPGRDDDRVDRRQI
jgi:hypothetical protein